MMGGRTKKVLTAVLCLALPGLFFLNAWQGYRFNALSDQVAALEKQQKDLLEANRDTIGQIAYETSPERVAEKAAALGLVPADPSAVTRLQVGQDSAGGPAQ
jgi:ABC-type phosphate transport system auxiliary subunit